MGEVPQEDSPFPLTEVDKFVLSQTDEEFRLHDWEDLKDIICKALKHPAHHEHFVGLLHSFTCVILTLWAVKNNLQVLKRKPSDLRRYMQWTSETKAQYGSMTQFLLVNRLPDAWGAPPFTPASAIPFGDPSDYSILINDWPYGLDPEIRHIVVWLRTSIATDPDTGDMTPQSRAACEAFIKRQFVDRLGPGGEDRVVWFKNWVALQSVRALEHIHVLVRNVDDDTLKEWTREQPQQNT